MPAPSSHTDESAEVIGGLMAELCASGLDFEARWHGFDLDHSLTVRVSGRAGLDDVARLLVWANEDRKARGLSTDEDGLWIRYAWADDEDGRQ